MPSLHTLVLHEPPPIETLLYLYLCYDETRHVIAINVRFPSLLWRLTSLKIGAKMYEMTNWCIVLYCYLRLLSYSLLFASLSVFVYQSLVQTRKQIVPRELPKDTVGAPQIHQYGILRCTSLTERFQNGSNVKRVVVDAMVRLGRQNECNKLILVIILIPTTNIVAIGLLKHKGNILF